MTNPVRTTDLRTASYRRFIVRTIVPALQDVFSGTYNRDRQLVDLRVTHEYPRDESDYPCIVVEYEGQRVVNAGVGHEEWFKDANGELQKWHHNRFEGTLNFHIFTLSTLDRDLLADAVIEVLRFGRLDPHLNVFFTDVYGNPNTPPQAYVFNQLMLGVDEISEGGNSETLAPWRPEDVLIYSTVCSIECQGGFYNIVPDVSWDLVSGVSVSSYPQGEISVDLHFIDNPNPPHNPFIYTDNNTMPDPMEPSRKNTLRGVAVISGSEQYLPAMTPQSGLATTNLIQIFFPDLLDDTHAPDPAAFRINITGTLVDPLAVMISNGCLGIEVASSLHESDSIAVTYSPTGADNLVSVQGIAVPAFSTFQILNNIHGDATFGSGLFGAGVFVG